MAFWVKIPGIEPNWYCPALAGASSAVRPQNAGGRAAFPAAISSGPAEKGSSALST
jgi:hypothetical protein